jgi:hypothetical protein
VRPLYKRAWKRLPGIYISRVVLSIRLMRFGTQSMGVKTLDESDDEHSVHSVGARETMSKEVAENQPAEAPVVKPGLSKAEKHEALVLMPLG